MSDIDRADRLAVLLVVAAIPAAFLVDTIAASTAVTVVPVVGLGSWLRHRRQCEHEERISNGDSVSEIDAVDSQLSIAPTDVSRVIGAEVALLGVGEDTSGTTVQLFVSPTSVTADSLRFHQIIRNLVTNAFRRGGDTISIRSFASNGFGRIEVSDNGPGIDAEEAEAVFAPYRRLPIAALPTGPVGLSLTESRHLARVMGGDLVAFRHDDVTTFRLCLPLAEFPVRQLAAGD
jgi:signal transduction histidine kinase